MIQGDYKERERITKSGKKVKERIVTSTTGVEYSIGKRLGIGGVAQVYRARRVRDHKECVFKEYRPSENPDVQKAHRNIKKNIEKLMKEPMTEEDGVTPLEEFVGPMDKDSLIELTESQSFGYIMEKVDTKIFLSIPKLWHRETYPDTEVLCKACLNIANLFRKIHLKGWCYKDINEGNIYINNKTGEIRMIDCDNISIQSVKTIEGTHGYMAPEVYDTHKPDIYTDYFSMAVLFYRMFVGGYPMDGKRIQEYLIRNNLSVGEAASVIYGKNALFAFDPKDTSNSIRGLVDPLEPHLYAIQTKRWDALPPELKAMFQKTFFEGLKNENRTRRATDRDWIQTFESLKKTGLVRCSCGKYNFADHRNGTICKFCGKKVGTELTEVVFRAKRDLAPTSLMIVAKRKQQLQGKAIYPLLNENWMKIEYSRSRNVLAAQNQSNYSWLISDQGNKYSCPPGGRVVLKTGLVITILRRQLQLTVEETR